MIKAEQTVFFQALELPVAQRAGFVKNACNGDPSLAASVQRLLLIHETEDGFLETPVKGLIGGATCEQPGEMVGNYRLEERIGEGGFGVVWRAEQLKPVQRPVALKIVKLGMDSENIVRRFDDERQILAIMNHPNIATVLDAGINNGRPYFVMELVEGSSIDEYCSDSDLTVPERLKIFAMVCRAVQHAHQKGIVHRDLKPTNILISYSSSGTVPKIIDFGIAKAVQSGHGTNSQFVDEGPPIGTPQYMSPEQLRRDADVDTRSDIYSLGIVVHRLVTGSTPFPDPEKPDQPQDRSDPDVTSLMEPELRWIFNKATSAEREDRYQSASELATEIERYLNFQPVSAGPTSRTYQTRKFIQRNKLLVGSALAIAIAMVVACIALAFAVIYANGERQIAEQERQEADRQKTIALNEADEAKHVAAILKEMIGGAHPGSNNPVAYTLREHLNDIAKSFDQLSDHPEVEAELRRTIAISYLNLSQHDKAEHHFRRSLELRLEHLGAFDPDTLISRNSYARCLMRRHMLMEAETHVETVIACLRDVEPNDIFLDSLKTLSSIRTRQRRFDEAHRLAGQCVEMSRVIYGDDHPFTIEYMSTFAMRSLEVGRLADAEQMLLQVLDFYTLTEPGNTFRISNTQYRLALTLDGLGKFEEAKQLAKRVVEQQTANLGETDPHVIRALGLLAQIHHKENDPTNAERYARDAVSRSKRHPQKQATILAMAYYHLAVVQEDVDPREAADAWRQAIIFRQRALGDHPQVASHILKRFDVLMELKEFDEAINCIELVIRMLNRLPESKSSLRHAYRRYSDLMIELDQPKKAEEYKVLADTLHDR